jgi:hypothetical protein
MIIRSLETNDFSLLLIFKNNIFLKKIIFFRNVDKSKQKFSSNNASI